MVEVAFDAGGDRRAALRAIGRAFAFPAWFGANLDALYDCLTDLPEHGAARGCVVILEHFSAHPVLGGEQGAAVLDAFRDAAAELAARGFALRVFCG
jgi:RNAse (barnase) inhibitor barstar